MTCDHERKLALRILAERICREQVTFCQEMGAYPRVIEVAADMVDFEDPDDAGAPNDAVATNLRFMAGEINQLADAMEKAAVPF